MQIRKWSPASVTHSRNQIAIFASFICNFDTASIQISQLHHPYKTSQSIRQDFATERHAFTFTLDSVIQKILQFSLASSSSINPKVQYMTFSENILYFARVKWNRYYVRNFACWVGFEASFMPFLWAGIIIPYPRPTDFSIHVKEVPRYIYTNSA